MWRNISLLFQKVAYLTHSKILKEQDENPPYNTYDEVWIQKIWFCQKKPKFVTIRIENVVSVFPLPI